MGEGGGGVVGGGGGVEGEGEAVDFGLEEGEPFAGVGGVGELRDDGFLDDGLVEGKRCHPLRLAALHSNNNGRSSDQPSCSRSPK